jgi:hypothetical protein
MTKRSQTTGLPKESPKKITAETPKTESGSKPRSIQREYQSRHEREAQIQRWVILGVIAAVVVIVAILIISVILDQFVIPNQAVASVEGHNITVGEFQRRARIERYVRNLNVSNAISQLQSFGISDPQQIMQQLQSVEPYSTWVSELQVPDQLGIAVVNELIDDQVIRNYATQNAITITDEDIDKFVGKNVFSYDAEAIAKSAEATAEVTATVEPSPTPTPYVSPTPSPTPTITPTPELTPTLTYTPQPTLPPAPTLSGTEQAQQFQTNRDDYFRELRQKAGVGDADVRAYFEIQVLREKVRDAIAKDITEKGLFVNARHILVANEEDAQDILAALNAGESFSDLAKSVSTDTSSGARGGELGWSPITQYVKEFSDAVKDAEIGAIIGPIKTQFGYHIIQVRAREERNMDENQLNSAKASAFDTWLKDYKDTHKDQIQTFSTWANYIPTTPLSIFDQTQ